MPRAAAARGRKPLHSPNRIQQRTSPQRNSDSAAHARQGHAQPLLSHCRTAVTLAALSWPQPLGRPLPQRQPSARPQRGAAPQRNQCCTERPTAPDVQPRANGGGASGGLGRARMGARHLTVVWLEPPDLGRHRPAHAELARRIYANRPMRFVHRLSAARQSCQTARHSPLDVCTRGVRSAACNACLRRAARACCADDPRSSKTEYSCTPTERRDCATTTTERCEISIGSPSNNTSEFPLHPDRRRRHR